MVFNLELKNGLMCGKGALRSITEGASRRKKDTSKQSERESEEVEIANVQERKLKEEQEGNRNDTTTNSLYGEHTRRTKSLR